MSAGPGAAPELAVILAGAGEGRRMKGSGPKLLLTIGGETLLERVAGTFLGHPAVGELVAVVPMRHVDRARALLKARSGAGPPVAVVAGGATRQDSVRLGMKALELDLPYVAVHDAARALVSRALITRVLAAAREVGAAIPALPLRETVKEVAAGRVVRTVPREGLEGAQTPQIFTRDILARAHARVIDEPAIATDDAWLVEAMGTPVAVVPGEPSNLKLTEPSDVAVFESHLRSEGGG